MPQAAVKRTDPTWEALDKPVDGPARDVMPESVASLPVGAATDARGLQASLQHRLMTEAPSASRWSARRTLAFVLSSSLVLWALIIWGGLEVVARLAG